MVRYREPAGNSAVDRKKTGFKAERDAKRFKSVLEVKLADKSYISKSNKTLANAMEEYINLYCFDLAPKTVESYLSLKTKMIQPPLAAIPIQSITPEDISRVMLDLQKQAGLTANTIQHYLRFLNLVFKQAFINNQLTMNPVSRFKKPKVIKHQHKILNISELSY